MINFIKTTDVTTLMLLFIVLPTTISCIVAEIVSRIKNDKSLFF